jgi:N-acetylglucosaminyldiphosphoundecaprenol N-acetyl-beta-D-mannosaminyltransferase
MPENAVQSHHSASSRALSSSLAQDWPRDVQTSEIVSIFGVRIANLPHARGLEAVTRLLARRATGGANGRARMLYFCNANTLTFALRDPAYAAVLNRADLVYGDGVGVRLAAAMRSVRMKANLNGTDLVPELLRSRDLAGKRCFLLGGEETANRTAAEYFQSAFPGLEVAGRHHGFFSDSESPEVIRAINDTGPDLLLVGMGHPRQEAWMDAHAAALKVPLAVAVGGLFAYWGNGLERASSLSRKFGMEWFEIMLRQPTKMRRYLLGGPLFLAGAALSVSADLRVMRRAEH